MKKRLDIHKSIYVSAFLIFTGLLSLQVHADGIASVNSYVEIKSDATDFRSRKQSNNGQRSTSGFDFIILKEQIFASKARAALYVLIHIALVATAMCQPEVRLQLILGTHQPILILFILMMTITMAPIGPR